MKYYFPTSTLNFSSIISSQRILPARYYAEGALWWNRYEKTAAEKDAVIILYNRFPEWEIKDPDRDNYPLVIAFEGCPVAKKSRVDLTCDAGGKKLTAIFTSEPVSVSEKDILAGKVEFIFRTEEEKHRILVKAESGVDECKVLTQWMVMRPDAFSIASKIKNRICLPVDAALDPRFDESVAKALERKIVVDNLIRDERLKGAELGYELGGYVRSLRSDGFRCASRERIRLEDWRKEVLPTCFNSILENFIDRSAIAWDPNRSAVLDLVEDVIDDFAKDKSCDQQVKKDLLILRNHWGSAEQRFKISEIENAYLQAFAAFLECGVVPGKYPRYLKSERLRSPEYMLALYGAIVGYTSFSRTLLTNESYLPQPHALENGTVSVSPVVSASDSMSRGDKAAGAVSRWIEGDSTSAVSFGKKSVEGREMVPIENKGPAQGVFEFYPQVSADEKLPTYSLTTTSSNVGPIEDGNWINICAEVIDDENARRVFVDDMEWFVGNHRPTYVDKSGATSVGRYYQKYTLTVEGIKRHMINNGLNSSVDYVRISYQKIPIEKVEKILHQYYGK